MRHQSDWFSFKNSSAFFVAIFLDGITLSLMFPLLNELLVNPSTTLLPTSFSSYDREISYSAVLFVYMFCWAWGNALISSLSDYFGRKPTLIISMLGKIGGFSLLLASVWFSSISLLVFSRIVDGLTNGVQPEAEAVGIDLSPRKGLRPAYIGYMLLPVALGDTIGSFLLSFVKDMTWLGPQVVLRPIFFGLGIALVALLLVVFQFKETLIPRIDERIGFLYPVTIFQKALKVKPIVWTGSIFLLTVMGWSMFFNYLDSFAAEHYHFGQHRIDLIFTMSGLGFLTAWTFLVRKMNSIWKAADVFVAAKLAAAGFIVLTACVVNQNLFFVWVFAAALFNSTAYATILGLFANAATDQNQGWAMGVAGALHFAGFGLSSLAATLLLKNSLIVLFFVSAFLIILSAALMQIYKKQLSH